FSADQSALRLLAEHGVGPIYGARPLERAIRHELETPLSRMLIAGEVKEGQKIAVSVAEGTLKFAVI
ncbi:MAG: hypothetical protein PHC61_14080, partial [Chitinivibrionales bacterium]|nr:hypothetical protein [Chitinivibrionales bacterium]